MKKKLRLSRETLSVLQLRHSSGGRPPATYNNCSNSCEETCMAQGTCQVGFCYTNGCPFTFPCGSEI